MSATSTIKNLLAERATLHREIRDRAQELPYRADPMTAVRGLQKRLRELEKIELALLAKEGRK